MSRIKQNQKTTTDAHAKKIKSMLENKKHVCLRTTLKHRAQKMLRQVGVTSLGLTVVFGKPVGPNDSQSEQPMSSVMRNPGGLSMK